MFFLIRAMVKHPYTKPNSPLARIAYSPYRIRIHGRYWSQVYAGLLYQLTISEFRGDSGREQWPGTRLTVPSFVGLGTLGSRCISSMLEV